MSLRRFVLKSIVKVFCKSASPLYFSFLKSFIIQVEFKPGKRNAYEELSHYFNGQLSYLLIGEIEKISAGGLCGYKAKYKDKRTVNEEYIFDIPNSRMFNLLDIYIMIKKSSITYDESYKNRIVAEILDGIESN